MSNNNKEAIELSEDIDLSRVDPNDRVYVREILLAVLQFQHPMPKLDVKIFAAPDHYNVTLSKWNQRVDLVKFVKAFGISDTRSRKMDHIRNIDLLGTDDDGKGKIILVVARSSGIKSEKLKK